MGMVKHKRMNIQTSKLSLSSMIPTESLINSFYQTSILNVLRSTIARSLRNRVILRDNEITSVGQPLPVVTITLPSYR